MALYEMAGESLQEIAPRTFTELGILERQNIQKALRAQITAITPNVKTMVLAEEFGDWVGANRRIDLLCLDDQAQLVVVELKRDNDGRMELQALRYAAMISTMRFEQAVAAHRKYLQSIGSEKDAEQAIRTFLGVEEGNIALSERVRIILAASDFSTELTTTVLWLNKQRLDIRCVQMRPHLHVDRVLLDIQQVIPLPEAEQYQVAVREKSIEQEFARESERDFTRYDLTIGDDSYPNLPKRRLIHTIVKEAIKQGMPLSDIERSVDWRSNLFLSADGKLDEAGFESAVGGERSRYFTADDELFHVDGKTFALTNQWGARTLQAVDAILSRMPHADMVQYDATSGVADEVSYGAYVVRRRDTGTIEVERDGVSQLPAMSALRELAEELNVTLQNGNGKPLNTRALGTSVMAAIRAR